MGAWGYEPFDNDSALDWANSLAARKALIKDLRKAFRGKGRDSARAAAEILLEAYKAHVLGIQDTQELIPDAVQRLTLLLEDASWLESWRDERAVKRSIKKQITRLNILHESLA